MLISTERLGYPKRGLGLFQSRSVYPDQADTPTATCHLQPGAEEAAICGHAWEPLIDVPGRTAWRDIPSELRCKACTAALETREPGTR